MGYNQREEWNADMGDTLPDISALTLASKRSAKSPNGDDCNNKYRNHSGIDNEVDVTDDDILFMGTNIRVKGDREEAMFANYNMTGQPTDSAHSTTANMGGNNQDNGSVGNMATYEDFDISRNSGGRDGTEGHENLSNTNGSNGDNSNPIQDSAEEITNVKKITHDSPEKPQTGFLLNFFRGKGAKATLKSIVKGKPVYNKVIDLDADCSTPCEFEDVNDALQHIVSARTAASKPDSVSGSMSNLSSSSNRRRKDQCNEYRHRHDHHLRRYYPEHSIIGLGRIDPAQMNPFDFYNAANAQNINSAERRIMTPEVFNGWVRAFFNVAVTSVLLYLGLIFIIAIGRDIGNGLEKRRQMVKAEAMLCQELYRKNKCRTVSVPALEQQCREWEACMYKDAILYDDASFLSAEVLGGVINKFVSQLDARTVGIVLVTFLALFLGSNCALSMSATTRPNTSGWFGRWFSRNREPPNGADLLQNGEYSSGPQMVHTVHNPYLQPNYLVMGSYPYVSHAYPTAPYHSTSLNYYNEDQDESSTWTNKSGRHSAWKRRFTSPWVDQN
ncbi:Nucleus export protein BRL1 [Babesia sp. Xinjiang]|uniref:Nucleus export protein BRL1 n=1 Tax=Babesia sp. Xinjiang TaxID=462227 RepID=UPI000A24D1FD|nr:Nucleus export protein BRL1 [Babesia sp. Xinjiang]XP_028872094.1 Nucleus export protein BRL1 [Babesia sp. Xinjiang]ORM41568.1 Nucleus export protein BRL1 [Babesia sp. Xinjiang]ORM41638.1 Nucleus export protein BRL1 [Babesia sp. Xinjiang]